MDGVFIQLAPSIMSLWSSSGKVQSVDAISSKKELGHCGFRSSNGQNASMHLLRLRGPWKCPRNKPQIHRIHRISWSWGGTTTLEAATCTEAKVPPDRCSAAGCSEVLGLAGEKKIRSLRGQVCSREKHLSTRDCTIPILVPFRRGSCR